MSPHLQWHLLGGWKRMILSHFKQEVSLNQVRQIKIWHVTRCGNEWRIWEDKFSLQNKAVATKRWIYNPHKNCMEFSWRNVYLGLERDLQKKQDFISFNKSSGQHKIIKSKCIWSSKAYLRSSDVGHSLLGMHSCKGQTSIKYQSRVKDSSHSAGQEICTLEGCFTLIAVSILQVHRGHMYFGLSSLVNVLSVFLEHYFSCYCVISSSLIASRYRIVC